MKKFRITNKLLLPIFLISTLWISSTTFVEAGYPHKNSSASSNSCEVRGTWLNYYAFKYDITRTETLQKIQAANLNTIFVVAPPIGDNNGWSDHEVFDNFLKDVLALDVSVHIWVANGHRSDAVDFTSTLEQEAQKKWVINLLNKYPEVDGVHFDYIRYDKYDVATDSGPYAHLPRVDEEKTAGVSNTVRGAYDEIKRLFPDKKLTTAVQLIAGNGHTSGGPFPVDGPPYFWEKNLPYHRETQQDPLSWIKDGYVDGVMPMNYTLNDDHWSFDVDQWKSHLGNDVDKVYMGLGWLNDNEKYGFDPAGIVRKINYGRSQGLNGFVIFQLGGYHSPGSGEIDWELVDALSVDSAVNDFNAPYKNAIPSCLSAASETLPPPESAPAPIPDSARLMFDSPTSVSAGETFTVNVMAKNVSDPGMYGVQFDINFDPALLSINNLQLNPNLSFVVLKNADNTTGQIRIAASEQGKISGLTGDITLLSFKATAAESTGTAVLSFANAKFSDTQIQSIDIFSEDHSMEIAGVSTPQPTEEPTPVPTQEPTPVSTDEPTPVPTEEPTPVPTDEPTPVPTDEPTPVPTEEPPTPVPTDEPTPVPTDEPTPVPTDEPTPVPTEEPTPVPTDEPTPVPTDEPTPVPTEEPTPVPTEEPTPVPTDEPTPVPTEEPPTPVPTDEPTPVPTEEPPTPVPTEEPTPVPTDEPTPTPEPTIASVFGQVILAGRAGNNWEGATITVGDGGQIGSTDTSGHFSIANVPTNLVTSITANAPGYLSATCTDITIAAPETALTSIALLSGDINNDDLVDISDATAAGASFGQTGSDLPADITRDGIVDIFDIVSISLNFGEQGGQAWNCSSK